MRGQAIAHLVHGSARPGVEKGVCEAHSAVLDAGEPWTRGPNGTILMGEDYSVAKRGLGQL